jgi:GT2 family glycosyltransferase
MMSSPIVSVVVLNWNGASLLPECIASLKALLYSPVEIIVVDNGSTDGSVSLLEKTPGISLVENRGNLGFAAGMNAGFKAARGTYVAALNNDITVSPDWLGGAIDILERDPSVGIVSCRQMNYFDRDVIDSLYCYLHKSLIFFQEGFRERYRPGTAHAVPARVLGVSGASTLYRKRLLDQMQGFDETFVSYHEESDLCMRAFLAGWKCVYAPTSVAYHRRSESFSRVKGAMFYHQTRNRLWFIYKYAPLSLAIANLGWILFTELRILRVVLFRERVPSSYLKGVADGFAGMPRLSTARRENMRKLAPKYGEYRQLVKRKAIPL